MLDQRTDAHPRRDRCRRHLHRSRLFRDRPRRPGARSCAPPRSTPRRRITRQGVLNVLAKVGRRCGGHRLLRARHDGRHQRADRAEGRRHRPDHHGRLPRRRSRSPAAIGRTSSTACTRSRPPSCRATSAASCPAACPMRARSGRRSTSPACRRSSTISAGRACRRSRSASCTAMPTRRTSRRVVAEIGRLWPEIAVVASHQITREWREYERSSTTRPLGLCPADRRALSGAARGGARRPRLRRPSSTSCSRIAASTRSPRPAGSRSPWSNPGRRRASGARPSSAASSASRTCSRSTSAAPRRSAR